MFMTFTPLGGCSLTKFMSLRTQLVKVASVCRLCGSSVAYSHHRVALFGKKASQERLASRISALLDITLNCDDGSANLVCEVQAES